VDVINIAVDRQKFMTLTGELIVDSAGDDQPFQGYWSKIAVFAYPTSIWRPRGDDPVGISPRSLAPEN